MPAARQASRHTPSNGLPIRLSGRSTGKLSAHSSLQTPTTNTLSMSIPSLTVSRTNNGQRTPMQVKIGAWSGGDPANAPGTIEWAKGPTQYSNGPFSMVVRSIMVQDYSTGNQYVYGDQTGTWRSIKSNGGTIFSGGNKPVADAPAVTATASGQPIPFTPHQTDSYTRPNVYPWVPGASSAAPQPTFSNYPGLPAGWTVSDSGKVVPPSSAPVSKPFCPLLACAFPPL
jgi:hypothetical protein